MGNKQRSLVLHAVVTLGTVLGIAGILLSGTASAQSTSNQTANGFLVSPVRSELTIDKGHSQTLTISVQNPTNVATVAKAVVNDFVASDNESGEPRLILDNNTPAPANDFRSLASAIPDISLGPKERKDVTVTLTVPTNASAGGYYGAVRFVSANVGKQSNVGLTASVGTLVLVTVPGNLIERLQLVQLAAAQNNQARSIIFSGNVSVLTRLQNTGNIHVQPFGRVNVKNMFGKVVFSYEFNKPRANILPNSVRKFIDPVSNHSWFGRYTISENLAYSQGSGNLLSVSATFWYLPVWFVIIVLVIAILIISIVYWLIWRRGGRHHSSRAA